MAENVIPLNSATGDKTMLWIERCLFCAILLILIFLHYTIFTYSEGLWRDEINTLNVSTLPAYSDVWNKMQYESYPILWLLTLRAWVLVFGETTIALRGLGLIVGLGTVLALWHVTRRLQMRLPLFSLILFSLCPASFFVASLRAYGLGVVLILLTTGAIWRAVQEPTLWRIAASLVAAILSVQCQYNNAFLLFAICMGAVSVGIRRRQAKLIIFPLGIGALAAVSLLPYLSSISQAGKWNMIVKNPVTLTWIFDKYAQAIDPSGSMVAWLWLLLLLFAVAVLVRILTPSPRKQHEHHTDIALYLLVTLLVSVMAYLSFIKILSLPTQDWNYLPLMALMATIMDKGFDLACSNRYYRMARIVLVAGIAFYVFPTAWSAAQIRKTNMDILATRLQAIASVNDFIVVNPFYLGVSFAHYFKGSTPWTTLPEIDEHSVHHYDQFKMRMTQREPIKSVLEKVLHTLQSGHRVWLVGGADFLQPGEIPEQIETAPNSPYGWSEGAYESIWSRQMAYAIQKHGQSLSQIQLHVSTPVNGFENVPLFVAYGWRP